MWLILAFLSAALLGFYDVFKKQSLKDNAVIPVLLLNTLFSSLIFLPFIILSQQGVISQDSLFFTHSYGWEQHKYILLKSCIVLASWLFAYFGLKHLPLTIVGPINATRPVMVLVGAMVFFAEHLNVWQWTGVIIALIGLNLLRKTSKKENISWGHNKWIALSLCLLLGYLGMHRFYEGKTGTAILWLCTGGLLGIGIFVDAILIAMKPDRY